MVESTERSFLKTDRLYVHMIYSPTSSDAYVR